jgi:hypothetical protein
MALSALFLTLLLAFEGRKVVFIRVPLHQSFVLPLLFCVAYDSGSIGLYTAALADIEYLHLLCWETYRRDGMEQER